MLLNALVHRNYMGAHTQIKVYDNSLSIWNEGLLPEGLTFDSLKRTHPSRPRNPLIADVCFKGGYIDAWGRGTIKILNACKEMGLPEPDIKEQDGGFYVSLFKGTSKEDIDYSRLNERQIKAIEFVRSKGEITNSEYQQLNKVSKATATRDLVQLLKAQILVRVGKGGYGTTYRL